MRKKPILYKGKLNLLIIIALVLGLIAFLSIVFADVFTDDTDTDFDAGSVVNMKVQGTGGAANLTSAGKNTSGSFGSQVFNANRAANWTNITITTEVPYGIEIGRGFGDNNDATDEDGFINTSGLVLLMHFNNESAFGENATGGDGDIVYDFSVDVNSEREVHNNGTTRSGATINKTEFKFGGGALELDGSLDFINITHSKSTNISGNITLSAWVYPTASMINNGIIARYGGGSTNQAYLLFVFTSGKTGFLLSPTCGTSNRVILTANTPIPQNQWSHVVARYNSSDMTAFLNGVDDGSTAYSDSICTKDRDLEIGTHTGGNFFDGKIDEAAIWNRSLSSDEINALYKRGALRLNLSVRTCNDPNCVGEEFKQIPFNGTGSISDLNLSTTNWFFQYNFTFSSNATNTSIDRVVINNVSINYRNVTTQWDNGSFVNMVTQGLDANANLTSDLSSSGFFASQVFDAGGSTSWNNITIETESDYSAGRTAVDFFIYRKC